MAQRHYDEHLGAFYSWMVGDMDKPVTAFMQLVAKYNKSLPAGALALDLGAGHGIQSIALSRLGYKVLAVDSNEQLLKELQQNEEFTKGNITVHYGDMRNPQRLVDSAPSLVVCAGDTLLHLDSSEEVFQLLDDSMELLTTGGVLIVSVRDYSVPLEGDSRFIPVKSSPDRILTCVLDYEVGRVRVTDVLHTNTDGQWAQKVSSYFKVRVIPADIVAHLERTGGKLLEASTTRGMVTIVVTKA